LRDGEKRVRDGQKRVRVGEKRVRNGEKRVRVGERYLEVLQTSGDIGPAHTPARANAARRGGGCGVRCGGTGS
jgi:hypothetical protein